MSSFFSADVEELPNENAGFASGFAAGAAVLEEAAISAGLAPNENDGAAEAEDPLEAPKLKGLSSFFSVVVPKLKPGLLAVVVDAVPEAPVLDAAPPKLKPVLEAPKLNGLSSFFSAVAPKLKVVGFPVAAEPVAGLEPPNEKDGLFSVAAEVVPAAAGLAPKLKLEAPPVAPKSGLLGAPAAAGVLEAPNEKAGAAPVPVAPAGLEGVEPNKDPLPVALVCPNSELPSRNPLLATSHQSAPAHTKYSLLLIVLCAYLSR